MKIKRRSTQTRAHAIGHCGAKRNKFLLLVPFLLLTAGVATAAPVAFHASTTVSSTTASSTASVNNATTGTAVNQFEFAGSWKVGRDRSAYLGDEHYSKIAGSYYQVRFTGTQVKVYTTKAPQHGIQAVSIDGGRETMVDLYAPTRANQVLLYTSPLLPDGPHTLKVRVTGTKNGNASDSLSLIHI